MLSTLPTPWTDSLLSLVSPKYEQTAWEPTACHLCERRSRRRVGVGSCAVTRLQGKIYMWTHDMPAPMWAFPRHARHYDPSKCIDGMSNDSIKTSACLTLPDALEGSASDSLRSNASHRKVFIFTCSAEQLYPVLLNNPVRGKSLYSDIHCDIFEPFSQTCLRWCKQEPSSSIDKTERITLKKCNRKCLWLQWF